MSECCEPYCNSICDDYECYAKCLEMCDEEECDLDSEIE